MIQYVVMFFSRELCKSNNCKYCVTYGGRIREKQLSVVRFVVMMWNGLNASWRFIWANCVMQQCRGVYERVDPQTLHQNEKEVNKSSNKCRLRIFVI